MVSGRRCDIACRKLFGADVSPRRVVFALTSIKKNEIWLEYICFQACLFRKLFGAPDGD